MNLGLKPARPDARKRPAWRTLWTDRSGVSAVEFAMILPFMLFVMIGMEIVTGALNQDRKISRIASSITDLVAQAQTVTTSELDAVMNIGDAILGSSQTEGLEIIVASVSFDADGKASIVWSRNNKAATPSGWTAGSPPPVTLPDSIAVPSTSVVVGQTNQDYRPAFADLYADLAEMITSSGDMDVIDLSDTYFLRPRLTNLVTCTDCP